MGSYRKALLVLFSILTVACQNEKPSTASKSEIVVNSTSQNSEVSHYQSILRTSANDSAALTGLTDYYLSENQPEKALPLLIKQKELWPSAELDSSLLSVYQRLHLYAKAVELMPEICHNSPTLRNSILHAELLQKAGNNQESNRLIDSILPFSHQKPNLLALKGINFLALEDTAAACAALTKSQEMGQQLNDSLYQLLCLPSNTK